jgi:hypothetical protein
MFEYDEDILTEEEMNMIIAADTKIEHNRVTVFQQIAADAIAHYPGIIKRSYFWTSVLWLQNKPFSDNMLTHKTPSTSSQNLSILRSISYNDN